MNGLNKYIKVLRLLNPKYFKRAENVALLRQVAEMKFRIFTRGEASDGSKITSKKALNEIGVYGEKQGSRRLSRGRRVDLMDLNDTSRHLNSLIVGKKKGKTSIGFVNMNNRNIAVGHEKYRKQRIYKPTKEEVRKVKETAVQEIRRSVKQLFR